MLIVFATFPFYLHKHLTLMKQERKRSDTGGGSSSIRQCRRYYPQWVPLYCRCHWDVHLTGARRQI